MTAGPEQHLAATPAQGDSNTSQVQPEKPLRVLLVHNYYQQPGGEDQVFRAEADLLERHGRRGHDVYAARASTAW